MTAIRAPAAIALVPIPVTSMISRRQATRAYTFGYGRAELIGAMINLTALGMVGLYLIYEAVMRFIEPQQAADHLQAIKRDLKQLLEKRFGVSHSTLEFEFPGEQLELAQHAGRVVPH